MCIRDSGQVTVQAPGQPPVALDEPYLYDNNPPPERAFPPVTVPPGQLWVMGDHRGASADSRAHAADRYQGTVAATDVIVRAFVRVWPPSRLAAWSVVLVPPAEIDRAGLHVCNVAGMRRAVAALRLRPSYVLTDGFPVRGFGAPSLAVWKGDQVVAAIAAASVVAKVTRDRLMIALHSHQPRYDFAQHKGYVTPEHTAALQRHGPCPDHRFSYVNVARTVPRSSSPAVGLPAYAGPRPSRDRLATAAVVGETPPAQWVRHNAVMAEETAT